MVKITWNSIKRCESSSIHPFRHLPVCLCLCVIPRPHFLINGIITFIPSHNLFFSLNNLLIVNLRSSVFHCMDESYLFNRFLGGGTLFAFRFLLLSYAYSPTDIFWLLCKYILHKLPRSKKILTHLILKPITKEPS